MNLEYITIGQNELQIEKRQLADTDRLTAEIEADIETLSSEMAADGPDAHQKKARKLLDRASKLPDPREKEPDTIEQIRSTRPDGPRQINTAIEPDEDALAGAWAGRLAGILLGKPVETWTRDEIKRFLESTNQSLDAYLEADVPGNDGFALDETGGWIDRSDGMVRDDDVDFPVAALETLRREGLDFDSHDLAETWVRQLPAGKLHTAECLAYRNILCNIEPPKSASYRNPYRELIGGQIRGDCYGWVSPGNPEQAATLAYRDARISHVRNGIYGAMWVAAMLAAVPTVDTVQGAIEIGLTEIPAESRFSAAVNSVLSWKENGIDFETAIDRIHARWDDSDYYECYHVLPNAQIVAAVLAWTSPSDLGTGLSRAVGAGFDTDCNGATVGSVIGLQAGKSTLPDSWVAPLQGHARTALADYPTPSIEWLASETAAIAR